jgi:1-acyl-sn-glycerol-3-phosphate acyltransferase
MILSVFALIFKVKKWKLHQPCPPEAKRSILIAAPHTSNWDFVYAMIALKKLGLNPRFTIKKEFNKFLIGTWIESLGALWIDRSPKEGSKERLSMTQVMARLFTETEQPLAILVTAEGTRKRTTKWKSGFYYTALEAKVPICLSYMDYQTRLTGVGMCFMPSGDIDKDMRIIMDFYREKHAKFPDKFALDERYA